MTSAEQEKGAVGKYFGAYLCILALATLQFFIAYSNLEPSQMLVRMLFVAIVEAAVGVLFFMHLWVEKRRFTVFVLLFTILVILGMQYGWTDSFRLLTCGGKCS
ncbi:MAG: cytochrome C oxidase subunit IV family protein [Terriglobales bacterium]